jgi:TRAP-type C4-dicarboxylate transport system substrate-binding protein
MRTVRSAGGARRTRGIAADGALADTARQPVHCPSEENPMRRPGLAAALLALAAGSAHAQQEIKLTACAGHAPVFLWVKHLKETFIPAVNRELARGGRYKVTWNEAYGGTLAKLGSELESIEQGICDLGIVGTVFHPAKMPLHNVSYAAPFGPADPRIVSKVLNEMHETVPAMRKAWEKYRQVYLTGFGLDDYGIVSTQPITRLEDLAGRKYAGPPALHGWIKGSGAVAVSAGLPQYYNDIKSGVYNGAITFASGAVPARLYEVAPHFTQTGFGAMYAGGISMHKPRHDALAPEVRAALKVASDEYASAYSKEQFVRAVAAADTIRASKGTVVAMSDGERARLARAIENPTRAWIDSATRAGFPAREVLKAYMDGVRREGGRFARDWDRE